MVRGAEGTHFSASSGWGTFEKPASRILCTLPRSLSLFIADKRPKHQ